MKIVLAPHEVLSQQAKPIKKIDKTIKNLIDDMKLTLLHASDPEGVGLAAPQVGESLQLFLMKPTKRAPIRVCINPKISLNISPELSEEERHKKKKTDEIQLEGCLSLKDIWGTVRRVNQLTMEYIDEHGKEQSKDFKGFEAIIVQHEYDHLQGILFPKRVLEQKGKLYQSHKNSNGEDEFEEIAL